MKINRNDLCPCGSGKKYKQCCLKKDSMTEYELIKSVVEQEGYEASVSDFICNLYRYMRENQWNGACHATCSILFVGLSELGYTPRIYIGEAAIPTRPRFDHSWIKVDEKVIDLAVALPLKANERISGPIVFDINIDTNQRHQLIYGIENGELGDEAKFVFDTPFTTYMGMFPKEKNGLWDILKKVFPKEIDIESIKSKYKNVQRIFAN